METFLSSSKRCLANLGERRARVILGNPTCDLDSAVCALVHGFLIYEQFKSENVDVVPVLNITRDEFRLKTEVVYFLKKFGVKKELLTFRNEINLGEVHSKGKLELILVDHHALASEDAYLASSVVEVIDHRPQDASWPWTNSRLVLKTVGSCATLVAQKLLELRPEADLTTLAGLLQGPILIDTVNFSKEADRATALDHEIIGELDKICGSNATTRTELYHEILNAKTDISELTPSDLLIKDLKVVNGIPIPGFPILVKKFLEMDGAMESLEAFRAKHSSPMVVLLGMDLNKDVVTRDIAVYSLRPDQAANKVIESLTSSTSPGLQLTEAKQPQRAKYLLESAENSTQLVLYEQGNVRATRKQILPIIQTATEA